MKTKILIAILLLLSAGSCKKEDKQQASYQTSSDGGCPFESYPLYTGTFVINLSQPDTGTDYVFNDTIPITGTVTGSGVITNCGITIRQLSNDSVIYTHNLPYSMSFSHGYIVPLTSTDSLSVSVYYDQVNYSLSNCTEHHSVRKTVKLKVNI